MEAAPFESLELSFKPRAKLTFLTMVTNGGSMDKRSSKAIQIPGNYKYQNTTLFYLISHDEKTIIEVALKFL